MHAISPEFGTTLWKKNSSNQLLDHGEKQFLNTY